MLCNLTLHVIERTINNASFFTRQNSNTELYLQNCIVRFGWVRQLYWFQDWLVETQSILSFLHFSALFLSSVVVFTPRSSVSHDSSGNVVFRCSVGAGSDTIRTIRYTINGGKQRTGIVLFPLSIHLSMYCCFVNNFQPGRKVVRC